VNIELPFRGSSYVSLRIEVFVSAFCLASHSSLEIDRGSFS
jgi:hypothetical protein